MLIRQTAPVFGASSTMYPEAGEWQINVSGRNLTSDTHYRKDHEEEQRRLEGSYVINVQRMLDVTASYGFSPRLSVSFGVPYVSASWSIPTPPRPVPGPRAQQDARGIGDVSAVGRYWLFEPASHATSNVAIGLGLKAPTGDYAVQDVVPDLTGRNPQARYVDQSIQPGDGGWGVILEAQGFRRLGPAMLFATGTYLANPRNTNGTPSLLVTLGRASDPANFDKLVNSVPDQYVTRVGGSVGVWRTLSASAAWRVEGLRRYDLLGDSNGFRRPGVAMFIEPSLTYTRKGHSWTVNVPVGYYFNRKPDPNTGIEGDATFPRYIALGSYTFRFGGKVTDTLRKPPFAQGAPEKGK